MARKAVLGAGVAIVVVCVVAVAQWVHVINRPVLPEQQQAVVIHVPTGSHFQGLLLQLKWLGLKDPSFVWRVYGRIQSPQIKAGEYRIGPNETLPQVLLKMARGEVVLHPLTIIEGSTVAELRARLASEPKLVSITSDWTDEMLLEALGCAACMLEGQFLPETYFFERGERDLDVLRRAHRALRRTLEEAWATRDADLPLANPDELLVLASLIEKETGLASERFIIAGVFVRRLLANMRLQTDPTVVYGLGSQFGGKLTRADLRTDHPWNTYTRSGLPPSAIALPSRASLLAASQPEAGSALYFVARGDGSHVFSDTLEDHNRAVNRYIRGQN